MEKKRLEVIFFGKVQGVFFRVNTKKFAVRNNVKGWVANCPDGTVKAVFEGDEMKINATLAQCIHDQPYARVTDHRALWRPPKGKFETFKVAYY